MGAKIFSPLGICRIVYKFPTGQYAVEFEHGGGHIFMEDELFPYKRKEKVKCHGEESQHRQICSSNVQRQLLPILSRVLKNRLRREAG